MSTATPFPSREIYASRNISSPGICIMDVWPEPTGARTAWEEKLPVWEEELPAWRQESIARRREDSINRFSAALARARTSIAPAVVLANVIELARATPAHPPVATISIPQLIAHIRGSLSLQIKQLAEALGVERPTVYAWIKEESVPRPQKRTRLQELYQLAKRWDELTNQPLGRALTEVGSDGRSILEILRRPDTPQALVVERFRGIVSVRARAQTAPRQVRKSLVQLAREHGIDTERVKEQNDAIDILTGKRVALD